MGFECGLTWRALTASTISDHDDDIHGDGFVRSIKFSLLGGGDICVFDGRLVHKVLTDGDLTVFEIISLGKDP